MTIILSSHFSPFNWFALNDPLHTFHIFCVECSVLSPFASSNYGLFLKNMGKVLETGSGF